MEIMKKNGYGGEKQDKGFNNTSYKIEELSFFLESSP